jgi:3-isopropylmalate/(R)-2-methylmalate dehydratase small subunit
MNKITQISGQAIPLAMNDVDTDLIIPAQFLTSVSMSGYGENVFRRLRDSDSNFVFNQDKYKDANILVTQDNFGCGSSREHAVWALLNAGIQAIIAESFADIFFTNAAKNSLVLIKQPAHIIQHMIIEAQSGHYTALIDIENKKITADNKQYPFEIDSFHQYCLINGLDHLDYLLSHQQDINTWSEKDRYAH